MIGLKELLFALGGIIFGAVSGYVLHRIIASKRLSDARELADRIIGEARKEAQAHKKEVTHQAQDEIFKQKKELEQEYKEREKEVKKREAKILEKEERLEDKLEKVSQKESDTLALEKSLNKQERKLEEKEEAIKKLEDEQHRKLQEISGLTVEEARQQLLTDMEARVRHEAAKMIRQIEGEAKETANRKAQEILATAIQRYASDFVAEQTVTAVSLPSEDMKGRIIGREGRNIRSFEAVTGTTLMIDETPDSVLISAFDPVKREIARTALESLLKDGRIHPSTIETAYEQAKAAVLKNVKTLGEEAMSKLKLKPAHPEVLKLLGQLHFRLSLNQNSLEHSIEVAFIASMLASELGLDPTLAKRAALFHDIGKAIDHEFEGSHAQVAAKMIERYGEDPLVVNAVAASHEEVPAESFYAPLIVIADRISAMRPGARCDSLDSYVDRVKTLEDIAKGFDGVKEAFALQAGREIRVIVEPTQLSDDDSRELARQISREIESSLNYPSTIKITVIREQRFCETAK